MCPTTFSHNTSKSFTWRTQNLPTIHTTHFFDIHSPPPSSPTHQDHQTSPIKEVATPTQTNHSNPHHTNLSKCTELKTTIFRHSELNFPRKAASRSYFGSTRHHTTPILHYIKNVRNSKLKFKTQRLGTILRYSFILLHTFLPAETVRFLQVNEAGEPVVTTGNAVPTAGDKIDELASEPSPVL